MTTASDPDPVVVLGMHRSGTSFLVRALNLSGLWLGGEDGLHTVEGRAKDGNPKGNYESREAIAINNAILARSGGAWFNPPAELRSDETDAVRMRTLCAALAGGRPPAFPRWGWKDPRTLVTLDPWLRALQRPLFVVGSFRHPTACARSLLARDRIPLELGYALWGYYNSRLLGVLEHFPHALVRFDVDKALLVSQTARACEAAGLRGDPRVIAAWHDTDLVRSRLESEALPAELGLTHLWDRLLEIHRAGCGSVQVGRVTRVSIDDTAPR